MTSLIAFAALDAFGRTGFGTLLGVVAFLVAVSALMRVEACLCAVTSPMTNLLAIDTGNFGLVVLTLRLLLRTVLECMSASTILGSAA